jgi:hypothetical protein
MVGWQRALKAFSGLCSCSMGSGGCYGAMVHRLAVYDTSVIYSSILLYHCGPCSSEESSRQRLLIDVVYRNYVRSRKYVHVKTQDAINHTFYVW